MERVRKIEHGRRHWKLTIIVTCLGAAALLTTSEPEAKPPIKLFDKEEGEAPSPTQQEGGEAEEAVGPLIRYGKGSSSSESSAREEIIRPVVHQHGTSTLVEVKVGGHDALMLLDTGATYTTITPWFANKIGAKIPTGGPSSTFRTANGLMDAPYGTVSSFKLGKEQVGPITFSLCESCGEENMGKEGKLKVVGLLGMNVLGRYRMQMEGGELELIKGRGYENQRADITPWLTVVDVTQKSRANTTKGDTVWELDVEIKNQSKHTIKDARIGVICRTGSGAVMLDTSVDLLEARGSVSRTLEITQEPLDCKSRGVEVIEAKW